MHAAAGSASGATSTAASPVRHVGSITLYGHWAPEELADSGQDEGGRSRPGSEKGGADRAHFTLTANESTWRVPSRFAHIGQHGQLVLDLLQASKSPGAGDLLMGDDWQLSWHALNSVDLL